MEKRILFKTLRLIGAILLCQAAGIVGSLFTTPKIPGWYAGLNKPAFNPPSFLFAPVWISLFLLMGISLFLVMEKKTQATKLPAFILFGIQLVLNTLWSVVFFGAQSPQAAFFEILLLWLAILSVLLLFCRISRIAAVLFVPYLLWVSFAAVLNFAIWRLNP